MKKDKTMVQEIKEYVGKEIEEVKRHTSVLTEDMKSQVKLVAEQYGSFVDRFNRIDVNLEGHNRRFDRLEIRLGRIEVDLKAMNNALFDNSHRLSDHDTRIRKLEMP